MLSCAFNMDSECVELKFNDSSMIAINCSAVGNEAAGNMYRRSELDDFIYNASLIASLIDMNTRLSAKLPEM